MRAVFDSDIVIEFLNGNLKAKEEFEKFEEIHISTITWMEVLIGAKTKEEEGIIKNFLKTFSLEPIHQEIAEKAIAIRRQHKIRLPDALIWATAQFLNCILVTRNRKDFPIHDPSIRIPW